MTCKNSIHRTTLNPEDRRRDMKAWTTGRRASVYLANIAVNSSSLNAG